MRRATSVLPHPVGPTKSTLRGVTSFRNSSGSCFRRQRLRIAIATARFASLCPTMCRSNPATTSDGFKFNSNSLFVSLVNTVAFAANAVDADADAKKRYCRLLR